MKKMLLKIAYDGTDYHGWQVQPNGITVQQKLQDALEELLGIRPNVSGCSRTDAGVHANEFYCHFLCEEKYPEVCFVKGLNSILPNDISAISCIEVPLDFHARYSSVGKRYIYKIYKGKPSPFNSRYAMFIERELDLEKINAFCQKIIGTHDFLAFSSSGRTVEDTVRTIEECFIKKENDNYLFSIKGNGFLYNMVRIIVGTAIGVSDGKIPLSNIDKMFESGDRGLGGVTASPQGLFLDKVFYKEEL